MSAPQTSPDPSPSYDLEPLFTVEEVTRRGRPPMRLQRQRRRGWRKPVGSAVVDRTTEWGNPWHMAEDSDGWRVFRLVDGVEVEVEAGLDKQGARRLAVDRYRDHVDAWPDLVARARAELAGRDLLCTCSPDALCHGDVLLELANGQT